MLFASQYKRFGYDDVKIDKVREYPRTSRDLEQIETKNQVVQLVFFHVNIEFGLLEIYKNSMSMIPLHWIIEGYPAKDICDKCPRSTVPFAGKKQK